MRERLKQWICGKRIGGHYWSPNLVVHNCMNGKKRIKWHYYYCDDCGKRRYVD